jgi:AcrR family transcriptional regulator
MDRIVTQDSATSAPSYAERRAAMADETRIRILDACVAILARGVAELSIPAVAREAGVSVPTVYRNFADKKTLVAETALYLRRVRGNTDMPDSIEGLPEAIRHNFEQMGSANELVAAALQSETILSLRRDPSFHQLRIGAMEKLLASELAQLPPDERENAVLMATVLCSSFTLRGFRDVTGTSPRRAAEITAWAVARLLGRDSLTSLTPPMKSPRKGKGKSR